MAMVHTDNHHIGGEEFQVIIDDGHRNSYELMVIDIGVN